ncbi:MAG: AAA family ATPase [Candidatus Aminicenantes bacterium]|nr:AAA family ATPase [Candidatus Aminicenantes bacterium]
MIRRIKIEGYKSFRGMELELRPLTVIFGPNASGKSNFLDALYFLSRVVTAKNISEAFRNHRGLPLESFNYGDKSDAGRDRSPRLIFSFEVDVEISSKIKKEVERIILEKRKGIDSKELDKQIITEQLLRYNLSVEALPKTGYLRVANERLCAIKSNGQEKKRRAFLEKEGSNIHLRMEGQARPTHHQIGLDHSIVSKTLYEPHYPHITAFRMELANWYTYYLEPRVLMREEVPLAEIESLGPRGENLAAFLNTLKNKHEKDYENLKLSLKHILPSISDIDIKQTKEGRVGLHLSENGKRFSSRLISEGTLRLIGLLCALHSRNPATMVAFEEPENGVHPVRLRSISELLQNASQQYEKQIIVTTHSPILVDYFENQDIFVCRKEDNQTMIAPFLTGPLYRGIEIDEALEDRIIRGDFGG